MKKEKAPKLKTLKSRACSVEELQASIVQLIELHNGLVKDIKAMQSRGQIMSRTEAIMNTRYGL